jgi:hypothetical protein
MYVQALGMACAGGSMEVVSHLIETDCRVCSEIIVPLSNACGQYIHRSATVQIISLL